MSINFRCLHECTMKYLCLCQSVTQTAEQNQLARERNQNSVESSVVFTFTRQSGRYSLETAEWKVYLH